VDLTVRSAFLKGMGALNLDVGQNTVELFLKSISAWTGLKFR
jgi:hypothetical protein